MVLESNNNQNNFTNKLDQKNYGLFDCEGVKCLSIGTQSAEKPINFSMNESSEFFLSNFKEKSLNSEDIITNENLNHKNLKNNDTETVANSFKKNSLEKNIFNLKEAKVNENSNVSVTQIFRKYTTNTLHKSDVQETIPKKISNKPLKRTQSEIVDNLNLDSEEKKNSRDKS